MNVVNIDRSADGAENVGLEYSTWERYTEDNQNAIKCVPGIIELARIGDKSSILDIGCGSGDFLKEARERSKGTLVGIDISMGMVEKSREIRPSGLLYYKTHIYPDNIISPLHIFDELYPHGFDIICLTFVLQNIRLEDHIFVLRQQVLPRLSPGGRIIIQRTESHPALKSGIMLSEQATGPFCKYFPLAPQCVWDREREAFEDFLNSIQCTHDQNLSHVHSMDLTRTQVQYSTPEVCWRDVRNTLAVGLPELHVPPTVLPERPDFQEWRYISEYEWHKVGAACSWLAGYGRNAAVPSFRHDDIVSYIGRIRPIYL